MQRFSWGGLLVLCVLGIGCTSDTGDKRLMSSGNTGASSAAGQLGDKRYNDLIREMEKTSADAAPKSTTQKVSGALKKATSSVGSALTIKPKVHKAPDPLELDRVPQKINADLAYQSGRLAESNGNAAAAMEQYERGLKDQPNHVPTLISLARLHDRQEQFDKAEKLYRRAAQTEPNNAMVHNDLGLCLARHDQADAAVAELQRAVKLEPQRKLYRNNLATVLVDLGRVDEARTELNAVHPSAVAHYNLGYLLYQAGKKERAHQEFTQANLQDATLVAARQMLNQMKAERPDVGTTAQTRDAGTPTPTAKAAPPRNVGKTETRDVRQVEVAQAPKRVTCRIEDAAPQVMDLDKPLQMYPASMQRLPADLRRTPPTGQDLDDTDLPTPDLLNNVRAGQSATGSAVAR